MNDELKDKVEELLSKDIVVPEQYMSRLTRPENMSDEDLGKLGNK